MFKRFMAWLARKCGLWAMNPDEDVDCVCLLLCNFYNSLPEAMKKNEVLDLLMEAGEYLEQRLGWCSHAEWHKVDREEGE